MWCDCKALPATGKLQGRDVQFVLGPVMIVFFSSLVLVLFVVREEGVMARVWSPEDHSIHCVG